MLLVPLLLVLVTSSVYGQGQTLRGQTLMHDDVERTYELHVPSAYSDDQAWPLVLMLHGRGGSGIGWMNLSQMNAISEREGFLVAYPNAIANTWDASPDLNVSFFDSLIDTLGSSYKIDASRIYTAGLSQGGIISYILGAARPDTYAAIASVSGTRPSEVEYLRDDAKTFLAELPNVPARPLPLLHVHGTADTTVPFHGGHHPQLATTFPSVEDALSEWLTNNHCDTIPDITELDDPNPNDELTVTLHSYENCSRYTGQSGDEHTAEVQFYRVNELGHEWAWRVLDTSTEIWNFFSRHELPASGDLEAALVAGDADRDRDFDQMDLVRVQVAAKYLTGQSATWGEGDWNGAPGVELGNPPPGDGLFDQLDIIAALEVGTYLTGPYAAVQPNGQKNDGQTSIVYDARTGELGVDAPAAVELTSINIDSASGIFTGQGAQNLGGSFDNDSDSNIFKATFGSSFGSLSFGNVAEAGLSEEFVLGDLSVIGSLAGGGDLGEVDLIFVPEPTSVLLLSVALAIGLLHSRRRANGSGD